MCKRAKASPNWRYNVRAFRYCVKAISIDPTGMIVVKTRNRVIADSQCEINVLKKVTMIEYSRDDS